MITFKQRRYQAMWKAKGIKLAVAGLTILALLIGGGCETNQPPTITSLTPSATSVGPGDSCTVTCTASDPDEGDTLSYAWSASGGAISGTGSMVTWIAPTTEGTYTVTVTVSDDEATVSDSCSIQVVNAPPAIASLTPSATNLAPAGSCTVTCTASDPDGDSLTYEWTASGGTITGTGSMVTWTAPAAEGPYTITVTVSDGKGGTDSESCAVSVEMKFGSIEVQSSPAGAAVYLNGVDTGNITPYTITNLAPGTYAIKLVYYHYKDREASVTVSANETTYINWSLTYAPELTLTIQPGAAAGKDTYVYISAPDDNWGDLERVTAGTGGANISRAYLEFSLASLPPDAVITSAKLSLFYWYTSSADVAPIGVYAVLEPWSESVVTWNLQPVFATTPEYSINVPAAVSNAFLNWYITDLVKGWWNGTIPNCGVMLKDTDESTEEAWKRFYSSDYATAAEHPKLIITYFDPTS
jgi:hypothetical protein